MTKSKRPQKPWASLSPGQRIGLYQEKSPRVPVDYDPSYDYFLRRSASREAACNRTTTRPSKWDEFSPGHRIRLRNVQDPRVPLNYNPDDDRVKIADYKRSRSPDDVKWEDMRPTRRLRLYMDGSPLVPDDYEPEEDEARLAPTCQTKPRKQGTFEDTHLNHAEIEAKRMKLLIEEVSELSPLEVLGILTALSESDETSDNRTWVLTNLRALTFQAASVLSSQLQDVATSE